MHRPRRLLPAARTMLPWLLAWCGFQALVAIGGRVLARRKNEGDESSPSIRRVLTLGGLELRPTNPQLARIRVDLCMAGGEIDLTGLPRPSTGIDVTVRAAMAGLAVRMPPDWRVWWQFRGVGGIGTDGSLQRTHDEHAADLRIHAGVLFGGIGVEAG